MLATARCVRADARADHCAAEPQVAQQYAPAVRVPEPRRPVRLCAPARHRHVRGAHGCAWRWRRRLDQRDATDALHLSRLYRHHYYSALTCAPALSSRSLVLYSVYSLLLLLLFDYRSIYHYLLV